MTKFYNSNNNHHKVNLMNPYGLSFAKKYFWVVPMLFGVCCEHRQSAVPPKEGLQCPQTRFENLDSALLHKNCVITLKLREAGLKKFPKEVVEFPNLKYLDLAMNAFDSVPDEIGQLTHLTDFITAYSSVKYISPAIGNLKKLRNINMIDNDLTHLPDSICALPALEMLVLKGNKITHLPQNIHRLTALKYIAVSDDEANPTLTEKERKRVTGLLGHCKGGW